MGMNMGPLVSTEWLAAELGKPDLVVFDATKYLPNEPKDGKAEFLNAHIPGARYFDIDQVADQDTDLPHMVPTPGRFAKLMAALGVSNTSRVVFYDQKGLASAARGWWMMGLFGHDRAAVLDGGAAGELVAREDPAALAAGLARVLTDPDRAASLVDAGRATVQRYDWSVIVDEVLAVYDVAIRQGVSQTSSGRLDGDGDTLWEIVTDWFALGRRGDRDERGPTR
jgi:hypothetical protein